MKKKAVKVKPKTEQEKAASRALANSFCQFLESLGYKVVDDTPKNSGPKIKCRKCKAVIQSMHRHDFRRCKCGAIAIDGGGSYTRIIGDQWEDA